MSEDDCVAHATDTGRATCHVGLLQECLIQRALRGPADPRVTISCALAMQSCAGVIPGDLSAQALAAQNETNQVTIKVMWRFLNILAQTEPDAEAYTISHYGQVLASWEGGLPDGDLPGIIDAGGWSRLSVVGGYPIARAVLPAVVRVGDCSGGGVGPDHRLDERALRGGRPDARGRHRSPGARASSIASGTRATAPSRPRTFRCVPAQRAGEHRRHPHLHWAGAPEREGRSPRGLWQVIGSRERLRCLAGRGHDGRARPRRPNRRRVSRPTACQGDSGGPVLVMDGGWPASLGSSMAPHARCAPARRRRRRCAWRTRGSWPRDRSGCTGERETGHGERNSAGIGCGGRRRPMLRSWMRRRGSPGSAGDAPVMSGMPLHPAGRRDPAAEGRVIPARPRDPAAEAHRSIPPRHRDRPAEDRVIPPRHRDRPAEDRSIPQRRRDRRAGCRDRPAEDRLIPPRRRDRRAGRRDGRAGHAMAERDDAMAERDAATAPRDDAIIERDVTVAGADDAIIARDVAAAGEKTAIPHPDAPSGSPDAAMLARMPGRPARDRDARAGWRSVRLGDRDGPGSRSCGSWGRRRRTGDGRIEARS